MKCIVPIAGPDLWTHEFGLRPLYKIQGEEVLKAALKRRSWSGELSNSDYIFVVRDIPQVRELYCYLEKEWPGCRIVTLPCLTDGAMLSTLAGMALVGQDEPIIVDLADILFSDHIDLTSFYASVGMIVPVFRSNNPIYSYLEINNDHVIRAKEKSVISSNASAGVYVFRDRKVFLAAALHSLSNAKLVTHNNIFFICPMVNGVLSNGFTVKAPVLTNVSPLGELFHKI